MTDVNAKTLKTNILGTTPPDVDGVYVLADGRYSRYFGGQWRMPSDDLQRAAVTEALDGFPSPQFRIKAAHRWSEIETVPEIVQSHPLSMDDLSAILALEDEVCDPAHVGFYPDLESLADKVRSAKNWSQGEIFVWAASKDEFVVMKQIAPSSCEMLTLTQDGYKDVLTAYRFEQDELLDTLRSYLKEAEPEAQDSPVP